jgi:K+ transporter
MIIIGFLTIGLILLALYGKEAEEAGYIDLGHGGKKDE